jgi:hypothetical protein
MKAKRPARLRSSSLSARWRSRAARRCHGRRHAGRGSGNVLDEALCVGRTAASFPAADEDYFRDTDYGVTKDAAKVAAELAAYVPGIAPADAVKAAVKGRNN